MAWRIGLFPALLEKHDDLAVYETVLGSGLLLGGTSALIEGPGLVLSDEVYTLQAAICEVQAPELVFNINNVQYKIIVVVGKKVHHNSKEESKKSSI